MPVDEAVEIIEAAIFASMEICNHYMAEIDATIELVGRNLEEYGINYGEENVSKSVAQSRIAAPAGSTRPAA